MHRKKYSCIDIYGVGKVAGGALLLAALATSSAMAQPTQAQRDAVKASCRADFIANCKGVQPGGLPALQCLQKNNSKLSSPCQKAVAALQN